MLSDEGPTLSDEGPTFSDEGPTLEMLDFTICTGSEYTNLFIFQFVQVSLLCLRITLRLFHNSNVLQINKKEVQMYLCSATVLLYVYTLYK